METNNKLEAIIFDLDGVITDSARYHYLAWKELADELNIEFDEEYNEKLKGVSRIESLDLILENGNKKDSFTYDEKVAMAENKNDNYKELIKQITPDDTLPGIKEFLVILRENKIKTAIASVSRNAFSIIDSLELNDYFDYIVDAAEVKNAKPFPDIFLKAAEGVKVNPINCIGVEDAKAGIKAIKSANMKAVGVGTLDQMQEADLVLKGTEELNLELLKKKFNMI